jgi:rsbT co-antagonist protein RsbR
MGSAKTLPDILRRFEKEILSDWTRDQLDGIATRKDLMRESELREQSTEFLRLFSSAVQSGSNIDAPEWSKVRELLASISRSRALQGFSPSETATFVFSLKQSLFSRIGQELSSSADALYQTTWSVTQLLDRLGLYTVEVYQKGREELIVRQQQDMLELSTPVVKLWDGILALPMIGTLDSGRTQVVMETLLQKIVESGAEIAIIDITGVPTVDTLTAQHLLKTVAAARLMGADCIISGIRPQIAQTIVHLAIDLGSIVTKATLADAFIAALKKRGQNVNIGAPGHATASR